MMASTRAVASDWSRQLVSERAAGICPPARIEAALATGADAEPDAVRDVLHHAARGKGVSREEVALLVQVKDPGIRDEIMRVARELHDRLFARRVSLSTPVCPNNRCINDCLYCPLRRSDTRLRRTTATSRDMQREIMSLLREGHRHFNLVFGEDRSGVYHARDMVLAAYGTRSGVERACRVDVNLNPLQPGELQLLSSGDTLGTYHVYQETYHPRRYAELHPDGPKADYNWRLTAHDRALEAGMTQLGLGILLGANDYRYDVTGLVAHARHLLSLHPQLALSVTLPRMLPSPEAPASQDTRDEVDDEEFRFIVAIIRLALPRAAIVMCTPAERETRIALYGLGVSEVSVGSLSYPGTYTEDGTPEGHGRLRIGRPRALEVLVYRMCAAGFVPDICAGDTVTHYRVPLKRAHGEPLADAERRAANSLLGLREYLMDYASPETARLGEAVIQRELAALPEDVREMTLKLMEEAEAGLRGQIF